HRDARGCAAGAGCRRHPPRRPRTAATDPRRRVPDSHRDLHREGDRMPLTHAGVLTKRQLQQRARRPAAPLSGIAFSIMLLLMFALLFGGAIEVPGGDDYLPFLLPGMLALAMMFGVDTTMTAMTADS